MIRPSPDRTFELAISRALRLGVIASSACLAVGLVMTLSGQTFVVLTLIVLMELAASVALASREGCLPP